MLCRRTPPQQRIQLLRRLAAQDTSIDLMSLDPPFTAEFANAGFLAPLPAGRAGELTGAVVRRRHRRRDVGGQLVVAPFWANTQVLWYRKSRGRSGRPRHDASP